MDPSSSDKSAVPVIVAEKKRHLDVAFEVSFVCANAISWNRLKSGSCAGRCIRVLWTRFSKLNRSNPRWHRSSRRDPWQSPPAPRSDSTEDRVGSRYCVMNRPCGREVFVDLNAVLSIQDLRVNVEGIPIPAGPPNDERHAGGVRERIRPSPAVPDIVQPWIES